MTPEPKSSDGVAGSQGVILPSGRKKARFNRWLFSLGPVGLSFVVYWPVAHFDFINYDDPMYVTDNPLVLRGLTWEGMKWAFMSIGNAANWHPTSWLSHMLDVELFGLDAGWHHTTNAVPHTTSVVLLFLGLYAATSAVWVSATIAALFAVHPQHVESVAWISERKDVLSGMFWMSGMLAYVRYVRAPGVARYLTVIVAFVLGLMAKPMVVTLPLVFLIMDFWPLGRLARVPRRSGTRGRLAASPFLPFLEKVPLFCLSASSAAITYLAQSQSKSISFMHGEHLDLRLANAALAYVGYLVKAVWPVGLTVYYPYNFGWLPAWKYGGATLILTAISVVVLWLRRRQPCLLAGWLWYVVVLVPVIGVVQVGTQAMADRYTYLPLIGVFIAASCAISRSWPRQRWTGSVAGTMVVVGLCVLVTLSWMQVRYWRDSGTLFSHAAKINPTDVKARDNLGAFLLDNGRLDEAIAAFSQSLRITPNDHVALFNLGLARCRQGNAPEARIYFSRAIGIHPEFSHFYVRLGRPCAE